MAEKVPDWAKADATEVPDWAKAEAPKVNMDDFPRFKEEGGRTFKKVTPEAKAMMTMLAGIQAPAIPMAGALQFLGINKPAEFLKANADYAKGVAGTPASVAEFAGELASPLPIKGGNLAEQAFKQIPKVGSSIMGRMGAQGATQAAFTPTENPDLGYGEFLSEKAKQMGGGFTGGALFGKATQMGMSPQVSEKLQMLKDMGMNKFTPGQLMSQVPFVGKPIQAFESNLTSLPFAGTMIGYGQRVAAGDFNKAMANQVLRPLGESVPKDVKAGNELLSFVDDKIANAYRGIEGKFDFKIITDPATNSNTITRLNNVVDRASIDLVPEAAETVSKIVKRSFYEPLLKTYGLSGAQFRTAEKSLGAQANTLIKSSNPIDRDAGFAIRNFQDALRNELTRQNPQVGRELMGIHDAFKKYLRIERAAAYRGADEGVFNPSQFKAATESLAGRKGTATGKGIFMPESQAAIDVLGKTVPDSATAGRLMSAKTLGLGAAETGLNLASSLAPSIAAGTMYNPLAMYLMTKLATSRPDVVKAAAPAASKLAGRAGGLGMAQPSEQPTVDPMGNPLQ
jgi:hypothetical protein